MSNKRPMAKFPVAYDGERNVITLDGRDGATLMLGFLLKAKFGEAFDPDVLLHPQLARLMTSLREEAHGEQRGGPEQGRASPFSREALSTIASTVAAESVRLGWWRMSAEARVAYLQEVVAAPYVLTADDVGQVLDDIESKLVRARKLVAAAEGSSA
jgi:hypothetical protein